MNAPLTKIPLSLYVHVPWCIRRCPYCDFNAHSLQGEIPVDAFLGALIADLHQELDAINGREVTSIFFGGGTPSLLMPKSYARLLDTISRLCKLSGDVEITMEANPGAIECGDLAGYAKAGINRLSLGVQSFDPQALQKLGRIHSVEEAETALEAAQTAGFSRLNLDLMYGLPEQSATAAAADLARALAFGYDHISWYQLTIEPNTPFYCRKPRLPKDVVLETIETRGAAQLDAAGLARYEVSAYARPGYECRHNLNYWTYGDYIGIGPGAVGKLTSAKGDVIRRRKVRQPAHYLRTATTPAVLAEAVVVRGSELAFEFLLNALRLSAGTDCDLFTAHTGLDIALLQDWRTKQIAAGLLQADGLRATPRGFLFLDELLSDLWCEDQS